MERIRKNRKELGRGIKEKEYERNWGGRGGEFQEE